MWSEMWISPNRTFVISQPNNLRKNKTAHFITQLVLLIGQEKCPVARRRIFRDEELGKETWKEYFEE